MWDLYHVENEIHRTSVAVRRSVINWLGHLIPIDENRLKSFLLIPEKIHQN